MSAVKFLYTEKKPESATAAGQIFIELKNHYHLEGLVGVRVFDRIDVERINDEDFEKCKTILFANPAEDIIYDKFPCREEFYIAVKYLPGQYDKQADDLSQCIQAATMSEAPVVEIVRIYVCEGMLTDEEKETVKKYFINPVDAFEVSADPPETLNAKIPEAGKIIFFENFSEMTEKELNVLKSEHGLSLSTDNLKYTQKYCRNEGRGISLTELKIIETYWSDHCRHSTFLTQLKKIEFENGYYTELFEKSFDSYLNERKKLNRGEKPITLMDLATMGMRVLRAQGKLDDLDVSDEVNACTVVIPVDVNGETEEWLLLFKNETHNHPTEIEPYGGAATCLGGGIRDPLSGRAYVYQAMRVTGGGFPALPPSSTRRGKLPQRKIARLAACGYSDYGNQIGLAAGHLTEIYHDGYIAKRMELGALVGAVKRSEVRREMPKRGDAVVLLGGKTGRDGCGGATGSSKKHTETSLVTSGAEVQKGCPTVERNIVRLFKKPMFCRLVKKCNDFGAGGVSVAVGELAEGLKINLDAVLCKYPGLDGTEIAISESQERMALVVALEDIELMQKLAAEENVEATIIAEVTDDKRMVMYWRKEKIADLSREFIDSAGVDLYADVLVVSPEPRQSNKKLSDPANWLEHISKPNIACQKGVASLFDATAGSGTVLLPYTGKYRLTPTQVMAAKIPVENGFTKTASIMSFGYDPYVSEWSPYHGAVYAVVESAAKIVAAGGSHKKIRLSFQEYFESMKDAVTWQKPFAALLGAFTAQTELEMPSVGGKDSMSGTFEDIHVPPALLSFAVQTANIDDIITPDFKQLSSQLVLLTPRYDEKNIPYYNDLLECFTRVNDLIKSKKIISAYALTQGGVAEALTKMALGNRIGAEIYCGNLYSSEAGSFLLEMVCDPDAELNGLTYEKIGTTVAEQELTVNGFKISLSDCEKAWMQPLESVYPTKINANEKNKNFKNESIKLKTHTKSNKQMPAPKKQKPFVFIPVYPGANGENEMKYPFEKEGAVTSLFIIKNLALKNLSDSIKDMARQIKSAQIIALPDGTGDFMSVVLKNERIAESIAKFLSRGGLVLGIGNGFKTLLRTGLLPYGKICGADKNSPLLAVNIMNNFVSDMVRTKIISDISPWLWETQTGAVHVLPFASKEARFFAPAALIKDLADKNQIAAQYVDFKGEPSMEAEHNPSGSVFAIEAVTNKDGRILGKAAHSGRIGKDLYKGFDFDTDTDQKLFKAGINFFG